MMKNFCQLSQVQKGWQIQDLSYINQLMYMMYHHSPQIISCLVSLMAIVLQKWKRGSSMVLREYGGMFNSWYNTSGNVGC